jgi:hypothetical protein
MAISFSLVLLDGSKTVAQKSSRTGRLASSGLRFQPQTPDFVAPEAAVISSWPKRAGVSPGG